MTADFSANPPAHIKLTEKDGSVTKVWFRYLQGLRGIFLPMNPALTANPGGGQANAVQLAYGTNVATVVANPGDSFLLQAPTGQGRDIFVVNHGANSCDIFPTSGTRINSLANDAAYAVPAGKCAMFVDTGGSGATSQYDGGTWG